MTAIAEVPAVNGATPNLNKALAAFQADAPKLTKGETGKVEGQTKDGRSFSYSYKYADLAEVCAAALPLLGKHGLSFFAKPVVAGNQFGLVLKLKHSSGEEEEGFYPLPSAATPQQVGSAITYARRYSMLMMTGLAPADDDDGAAAERQHFAPQSAGEAFDNATPATPRQQGNGRAANGTTVRPAQAARPPAAQEGEADPDAQPFADEVHEIRTLAALKELHTRCREAHKLAALIRNPTTGGVGGLGQYIGWKKTVLEKAERALADLRVAADTAGIDEAEMEHRLVAACGHNLEEASAEEMTRAAELILAGAGSEAA